MPMELNWYDHFEARGWALFPSQLDTAQCQSLSVALDQAIAHCQTLQERALGQAAKGTAHHLLCQGEPFVQLLEQGLLKTALETLLEGPILLNSFGGINNLPQSAAYVHHMHRDQRTWLPVRIMVNMLIFLDDFLPENGATWLLEASHQTPERPPEAYFWCHARQVCGGAGSILLFDGRLWHAAGHNQTQRPRRGLTLTWTRPWVKPQFDYLGLYTDQKALSENLKQFLGYYARIPKSLEEWYQPPCQRFYRPEQG